VFDTVPGKGTIARCSKGYLGLILSEHPIAITYLDGSSVIAWTGVHLSGSKLGDTWSSCNPTVVGKLVDEHKATYLSMQHGRIFIASLPHHEEKSVVQ